MTLAGLGKLSPNMVLMGFKNNWKQDLVGLHQYMDVMYSAFDLRLSFAILRCKEGLDFSSQVPDQTKEGKAPQKSFPDRLGAADCQGGGDHKGRRT